MRSGGLWAGALMGVLAFLHMRTGLQVAGGQLREALGEVAGREPGNLAGEEQWSTDTSAKEEVGTVAERVVGFRIPPPEEQLSQPMAPLLIHSPFVNPKVPRVRLCCWLPVNSSANPEISPIQKTWGRECDHLIFFSRFANPRLNMFAHGYVMEDKFDLWNIVHRAWALLYNESNGFYPQCDFYIKIDADSYFGGFNFKLLVSNLSADDAHYLGHMSWQKFPPHIFALGASIAISRGALRKLGPHLPMVPVDKVPKCEAKNSWAEDWQFYKCLKMAGVNPTLTFDKRGREHFFIYKISSTLRSSDDGTWLWDGKPKYIGRGTNFSSPRPVTFHSLKWPGMNYYDFYLNYLFWTYSDPLDAREVWK